MGNLTEAYLSLAVSGYKLRQKFLCHYLTTRTGQIASPDEFEFEVRSFCVLFHASLEAYIEGVAFHVYKDAKEQLITTGKVSKALFSLIMHTPSLKCEIDEDSPFDSLIHRARVLLDDKADAYIDNLLENNHGAGKKYLKNVLMRLGIDINESWMELESLQKLVNARGEFAHWDIKHQRGKVRPKIISPDDADEYLSDCLKLAKKILMGSLHITDNKRGAIILLVSYLKALE